VLNRKKNLLDDRIKRAEDSHKILMEKTSKIMDSNYFLKDQDEKAERRQRLGSEEIAFFKGRKGLIEGYNTAMSKN
jgi:hypothetical protein